MHTHAVCLSLCLPLIAAVSLSRFLAASNYTVGEVIYKATPARARARAARNRIRYIPPRRQRARKFAIADNDTERLMAPRRAAPFVFGRLAYVDKSSRGVPD